MSGAAESPARQRSRAPGQTRDESRTGMRASLTARTSTGGRRPHGPMQSPGRRN